MKPALACLWLLLALPACGPNNLPDYDQLGPLRILAMKADTPEVDPTLSPTVNVTPVVSDLGGGANAGRMLSFVAVACPDPGVSLGAPPACPPIPGATPTPAPTLASGTFPPPTTGARFPVYTGTAPAVAVPIPSNLYALTGATAQQQFNGVSYLLVYTLTATDSLGGSSSITAIKRIIASSKTPKNTNPGITDVSAAGATDLQAFMTALTYPFAGTAPVLAPILSPASAETYPVLQADGSQTSATETLTTTWFISDGSMTFDRTNGTDSDTWTPPSGAQPTSSGGAARGSVFVVVVRDGRGGEDFLQAQN